MPVDRRSRRCGGNERGTRCIDRNPEDTNCTRLGRREGNTQHSAHIRASMCAKLGPLSRRAEFILGAPRAKVPINIRREPSAYPRELAFLLPSLPRGSRSRFARVPKTYFIIRGTSRRVGRTASNGGCIGGGGSERFTVRSERGCSFFLSRLGDLTRRIVPPTSPVLSRFAARMNSRTDGGSRRAAHNVRRLAATS